ncbi:MAG: T9SS type A sorting domain-containing protein [Saprospiraceae bacterium]|nr:T9SS type A sorting domain-containing protein [Saprospiraceae bacterium]
MKALYKLTLLASLTLSLMSTAWQAAAQCGNDNSLYLSGLSVTCDVAPQTLSSCTYGGEYNTVNVVSGNIYTFSTCGDTDFDTQITLYNDANGAYLAYNDDGCGAQSTVTWTATFTGLVRVLIDSYYCTDESLCMTLMASCTSGGGGGGCTNTSSYGSGAIDPSGSLVTINTCSFAGEYSVVTGAVAGQTLQFTYSLSGGYITVRSGSSGGPIVAQGNSPLSFLNSYTGTLYAHWNTSSACGGNSTCSTTTVQCTSCSVAYDPCASITTLTCGQSTTASSTGSGAWSPGSCGYSTPGQEKVYSFTATTSGMHTLVVTSTNSAYSDYFYKAASGGCNSSGWVCIDDIYSAQSSTFGPLTAGTTYYILYDPESTVTATQTFRIDCPVLPCNAPGTPSASNVSTTSATVSWGAAGGATSYDWTVGTGASCPTGTGGNTAATSVNLTNLTPNTTYRFCVRTSTCGGGGPSGYVSTTFTTAPLANDNCSGAQTVTCGSTINGSTVGASSDSGQGSCGSGGTPGNGVWYKLVGNGAQVTLNLCGSSYDTKVHVYSGSCGSLSCVGSNDDDGVVCGSTRSRFVFNASVGVDYYILVSGFSSSTGAFSMNITCLCGPALGAPWTVTNIGASNGGAIDNVCDGTIDVSATNYGSPTNDVQTYAWQQMCGNGFIKAKLNNVTNGGWGGIMFRENNAGGSKKIALRSQLTNAVVRDLRAATNGVMQQQMFPRPNTPQWLRLTRNGNVFLGETSVDGVNWDFTFSTTLALPSCIEVGLFAQSINVNTTTTAVFSNIMGVALTPPVVPLVQGNNDTEVESIGFGLFPNPATDEVNIKLPSYIGKQVQIAVYNNVGQAVIVREIDEVQDAIERLPLNELATGVYFVTVRSEGVPMQTQKLIVGSPRP